MTTVDRKDLLDKAKSAAEHSYVFYSKKPKGAALLAESGKVYTGAQAEIANWSSTICAEVGALSSALAAGERKFVALAVVPHRVPCGTCLQAFREFTLKLEIVTSDEQGNQRRVGLEELLPNSFGPDHVADIEY